MTHGSQARTEYRVVVDNGRWGSRTEWFLTEEAAQNWIEKHDHIVIGRGWEQRVLDY